MTETLKARVACKRHEALDICTFELVAADGGLLPTFSAGAHIEVQVSNGLTRQYSLCNSDAESHRYLIGVLREANGRGGSQSMHERVHEGDVLTISAPRNHFPLVHGARRHQLFAGGIGITPILCMAERLHHTDSAFALHYCTRTEDRTAFAQRIRESPFHDRVHFHFDQGPSQQRIDIAASIGLPERDAHVYVCGPKGFMDAVLNTARRLGWPPEQLHYELFSRSPLEDKDNREFEVLLARSRRIVRVAHGQSIVQALAAVGVNVPVSCEQGICGTCLTRVLEGKPDHRDLYLSLEEQAKNDQILPCCSRSRSSRLVLDL